MYHKITLSLTSIGLVLLFSLCLGDDTPLACYGDALEGTYIVGCVDDCLAFPTLMEAKEYCDTLPECGGVTLSMYADGDLQTPWEVRKGPAIRASDDGDVSFMRSAFCEPDVLKLETCYGEPLVGFSMNGCAGSGSGDNLQSGGSTASITECPAFHSLEEARRECNLLSDCGGITLVEATKGHHPQKRKRQQNIRPQTPWELRRGPGLVYTGTSVVTYEHAQVAEMAAIEFCFSDSQSNKKEVATFGRFGTAVLGILLCGICIGIAFAYSKGFEADGTDAPMPFRITAAVIVFCRHTGARIVDSSVVSSLLSKAAAFYPIFTSMFSSDSQGQYTDIDAQDEAEFGIVADEGFVQVGNSSASAVGNGMYGL